MRIYLSLNVLSKAVPKNNKLGKGGVG